MSIRGIKSLYHERNVTTKFFLLPALLIALNSFGAETCYELSDTATARSSTPEVRCLEQVEVPMAPEMPDSPTIARTQITLKTGMEPVIQTVATFLFSPLPSGAGAVVYGIDDPSNSVFNNLAIVIEENNDTLFLQGQRPISLTKFFISRQSYQVATPEKTQRDSAES